ncbi:MAG TPA: hypothetical protein VNO21_09975 [Polyangiaceae bacterium]|nr:hypothetical protein [Polyangiaceae bacterium]
MSDDDFLQAVRNQIEIAPRRPKENRVMADRIGRVVVARVTRVEVYGLYLEYQDSA